MAIYMWREWSGWWNGYFTSSNWNEYQTLVNNTGSVQFQDSWARFRFQWFACYIGNRVAIDVNGSTFRKIDLDNLTVLSSKSTSVSWKIWYFGEDRILTRAWIMDFDGNIVTSFSSYWFNQITPWDEWVVWANKTSGRKLYKWVVNGDNVTFTEVWTVSGSADIGYMGYWHLWAYSFGYSTSSGYWAYINPSDDSVTNVAISGYERAGRCLSGADWKMYRFLLRGLWWWKLQRMWTTNEEDVGTSLWTGSNSSWWRFGKFLWNIVVWAMNTTNGTGSGYGTNNYFIGTDGSFSLVQTDAWSYDTNVEGDKWFIDENWWIYPITSWGGTWVILKTNKTFTNLNWKNPYLYR